MVRAIIAWSLHDRRHVSCGPANRGAANRHALSEGSHYADEILAESQNNR